MKYTLGIDYGTLSGRCVLVSIENGEIIASAVSEYKHAVMDERLPDGTRLPLDWALQHPQDYLDVLTETIPKVLLDAGVSGKDIIGIGIDFTSCTVLPIDSRGIPLCFFPKYEHNPHAYVKLWKHHAAQPEADLINEVARQRNESFLERYGGKISSEWLFPKLLQILLEDEELYNDIDCFLEACDWIVYQLTGNLIRNESATGFKAIWSRETGYPSSDFFKNLDSRFEFVVKEKMKGTVLPVAVSAGHLLPEMAAKLGLTESVVISTGHLDAACSLMGAGINTPGNMLAVVGTSTCHMILGKDCRLVPGICGYVDGGFNPGFYGYEAGQSCVGDHFQWFTEHCVPQEYFAAAAEEGVSIFQYLAKKAAVKKVGATGLLALDWWNGNRSVLVDGQLSGLLIGCTLQTKAEDIYRALIESTAYGTKVIIDNFNEHGIAIKQFYCSGGIARKDAFMMQIYADVLGMDVHIVEAKENAALSASILGAVAAKDNGGYATVDEAISRMAHSSKVVYHPNPEKHIAYIELYKEYVRLYDYFGRGGNDVMKKLKIIADTNR